MKLVLPLDQQRLIEQWNDSLSKTTKELVAFHRSLKNENDEPTKVSSLVIIGLFKKVLQTNKVFENVYATCNRSEPAFLNDASYPEERLVQPSWVVVKNLNYGVGVIAHEIGHVLSYNQPELFKKTKECVASKQENGQQYLEEDFADFMSNEVLKKLKANNEINQMLNKTCGYGSLKNPDLDRLNIKNEDPSEEHSSDLYRLLSIGAGLNNQTNECKDYIKNYLPSSNKVEQVCEM